MRKKLMLPSDVTARLNNLGKGQVSARKAEPKPKADLPIVKPLAPLPAPAGGNLADISISDIKNVKPSSPKKAADAKPILPK